MNTIQKFGTVPVAALLLLAAGGIGSAATSAFAQSASTSTGTAASQQMPGQFDQHRGGHIGRNGVAEVLLTGDAAAKLTAAAQAAQPGATIERASWNRRHGLPDGTRLSPYSLAANENGLYVFCGPHPADGGSQGAALFMDDGQNFHPLYDATNRTVRGGGVGTDAIWVIVQDGTGGEARELANPDGLAVPPNVSGRTFDTAANVLVSPWLHMGLVNTNKRLLFFEIDCLKSDGTKGLNSGATVQVEYRGRGSASWTSAGTLTSAGVFPAVLAVAGGWSFKELQVRLTLTAGSSSAPALVRALKIGYRPRPKVRHTYQVRVDLRDEAPAFATADGLFAGYSASKLRTLLDEFADNDDAGQEDTLVGLAYGGEGNLLHPRRRSIPQCELTVLAQEDATGGDGLYLLAFSDVSARNASRSALISLSLLF
jgi:hypothetical protein